ncbi:Fic family protein [Agarivorans sp. TSD2052]|uniref:Fic family protein n=1 Tax=Agarivorans sp. TSD2052 TaxID=2937286 RepID=UPI00200CB95D|nr:Fic family protein [Agarivorans sp. TSD2052]UPW18614.1 Fic family protein [Agarivorans sp. TSD2052]
MKKKVYGIETPPIPRDDEFSRMPPDLWSQVDPKKCGFDSKGNYLSWDEFITRPPHFKQNNQSAWYVLGIRRNLEVFPGLAVVDEQNEAGVIQYSPSSLMGKLHKIDRLSTLKHLQLGESNRNNFLSASLVMEEAITSAQMEGAATTRPVAKEMLSTGRKPRDFSEEMILNNYQLMKFANNMVKEPLSVELIQEFNRVATQNVCENDHTAGMIRTTPIAVVDEMYGETIHTAPEAKTALALLMVMCSFANAEHEDASFIHPIVKAVMLHFMVGYIHPFADGNGRTARALFYWYMLKSGYTNFQYISISTLLKESKSRYARAFVKTEVDRFDATHFIDFNLTIIIRSLEHFSTFLQNKIDDIQKTRLDLYKSPYFNEFKLPHITIIQKALDDPGREFTVVACQTEFNVSATAARAYLDKLAKLELLLKHPLKGRMMGYFAPRDLRERLKLK